MALTAMHGLALSTQEVCGVGEGQCGLHWTAIGQDPICSGEGLALPPWPHSEGEQNCGLSLLPLACFVTQQIQYLL